MRVLSKRRRHSKDCALTLSSAPSGALVWYSARLLPAAPAQMQCDETCMY